MTPTQGSPAPGLDQGSISDVETFEESQQTGDEVQARPTTPRYGFPLPGPRSTQVQPTTGPNGFTLTNEQLEIRLAFQ